MNRTPTFIVFLPVVLALCLFASGCVDSSTVQAPIAIDLQQDKSQIAGYWEQVAFTNSEINAVLDYANTATLEELDQEADIDIRAARSILKARPVQSMEELSSLYFVGGATLGKLKVKANKKAQALFTVADAAQALAKSPLS
ncbi:MAG: hypothetical protein KC502_19045 [Myxococcales bacterium]|nr:hypothetical protein [Myxococcales bacterium]